MKNSSNKKILICSYYFPPTKSVATVRIFNFHIEAQKHFQEVFGLTTSNRQLFPKDHFPLNDNAVANITEVWTYDLRTFLGKKNNASTTIKQSKKESRFGKFIIKLAYSFPFNFILGDGGLTYILGGFVKGKKLIREKKIDVIFSTFKPYSNHLICYLLKRWNSKLIWIADFRDLHVDEMRDNVYFPKLQHWFNRQILKRANIVTTVSRGLTKNLSDYHDKIYVLRNSISSTINQAASENSFFPKFTISYTGSIYANLRSAELLFKALESLIRQGKIDDNKIQISYAGTEAGIWQKWVDDFNLQKINIFHGIVPMEEAKSIQQKSQINLLLSWASENQQGVLTAKFYEYLAAQNPILLIIKGSKDDEFEKIFDELNAGIVAYDQNDNQKKVEDFILKYYQEWLEKRTITRPIKMKTLQKFHWDFQMEQFLNYLEKEV
ncbi:MAG: hypothetical protein AB8H03_23920 [Saprospiraceae bacterium]